MAKSEDVENSCTDEIRLKWLTIDKSFNRKVVNFDTPPNSSWFCNRNSLKTDITPPGVLVLETFKVFNKLACSRSHCDCELKVGLLVGCADGRELGKLVGNFVGLKVRFTYLTNGAEVVGTDVLGMADGFDDGCLDG